MKTECIYYPLKEMEQNEMITIRLRLDCIRLNLIRRNTQSRHKQIEHNTTTRIDASSLTTETEMTSK